MRNLVPALASPRQAGELLRVRPAEDYISKFLYGSKAPSAARQQAVVQTGVAAMTPKTLGEEFNFPDFDPETGQPLVNIDFSEGYAVPIYGDIPENKRFKNLNAMRR